MQPLMRLFHPGVLIPWDRILRAETWGGMLMRGIALRLDDSPGLLIFKRRDYVRMQEAFPERLRVA
jgi:hypothetical protein